MDISGSTTRIGGPAQRKIIRGHSRKRKSKSLTPVSDRVQLEKVLGFTCNCNAALACDPSSGLIAYPAGCVVVLLNSKNKSKQTHILSKKTITCLAFSGDGRHLVTGECGYQPMVRVWDVEEKTQVAEFAGHKFGINCVVFSPNLKYIVSIGSQHDMGVIVWNWRSNTKVASNKVASKVTDISFSEDGSYFVTVGNRHVKFWYLDTSKSKVKEVVPLNGRSGILGEQKNNFFCGVACGRGANAAKTFVITQSGLLCEFNEKRLLDKWVELRVSSAQCITVSEQHIYSGCADGVVRVFSTSTLHYVTSLPKPHYLGVDVSAGKDASTLPTPPPEARFPDCAGVRYDSTNKKVTTVYNDHSMYVWDVSNLKKVGKARSYMYHSACIWGVEVYPQLDESKSALPPGSFVTCSSDDTIRIWNIDPHQGQEVVKRNIYSQELLKVIYTDKELSNIKELDFNPAGKNDKTDTQCLEKNGVRCVKVSPDGQHLASGDRMGNIRIHDLQFMDEVQEVEAHDSEVLCLEFTRPETGVRLLASASRDRLIHVFDVDQRYGLVQTLDDHSSAITAVHFAEQDGQLHMLSCGADKSILFRTAQQDPEFGFVLNRHLVGRTTLYDMDIDVGHKFVATACQDRNVRIYNIKNGKQKKCYKGSMGDDGTLIKVQLDPSGGYVATSCSNKTLAILDFFSGECLSTMFGHSELVTGVRFTNDLKHLISVAADGCIFVWRLPSEFTQQMTARLVDQGKLSKDQLVSNMDLRRGTFVINPTISKSLGNLDSNENKFSTTSIDLTPVANDKDKVDNNANEPPKVGYRFSVGQLPAWAKRTATPDAAQKTEEANNPTGPRGRWAQRIDNQGIIMKSMLDENSAIQLSLAGAMDRRRYTVEQDSIQDQLKAMRDKTDPKHVPIITDDDETNKDDEDDDEFCSMREQIEKRLNSDNDPNRKMDGMITYRRGSDGTLQPKPLVKTNSIDLLLDEGEDDDEDEEDTDADNDQKDVIYFLPNEGSESSETIASSFHVYEGDTTSYKDAESEGTDPLSISDEDSEPPTPTTPGDPTRDFMSQAERDFENLGASPALEEAFTTTLDDLENQIAAGSSDPSKYFSHSRLSISSRFISRAQTQHLRNIAMQSAAQQRNGSMERTTLHGIVRHRRLPSVPEIGSSQKGGWKHGTDEDAVPERDQSPALVSQRSRPRLDPPPPPQPTRLGREEVQRGRQSLGSDAGKRSSEEFKEYGGRRSLDSASHLNREWKSMADMSGRVTPTLTKPAMPTRSRTPTSYRSTTRQRNHSPVRYVARTEVKLSSPTRGRSISSKEEQRHRDDRSPSTTSSSAAAPRSKSATPLDNSTGSKRKSLPRQHSYQKPTESSSAKTSLNGSGPVAGGAGSAGSKGRFAGKKGGKLNSAMKSKFKSTPDLAAALHTEELKPLTTSKTMEDIGDLTSQQPQQNKKAVRRSMPATREMKDPFGVSTPAVEPEAIVSKASSSGGNVSSVSGTGTGSSSSRSPGKNERKVSIGDSHFIEETKAHRKLPTPNLSALDLGDAQPPASETLPSVLVKSQSEANISAKAVQLKSQEEEDRLKMPPPPPPAASTVRRSTDLTLAQAKAILLGDSTGTSNPPATDRESPQRSPEKEKSKPVPIPPPSPPKRLSRGEGSSLDVPLEGSPDKETVPPPGVTSVYSRLNTQEVMPFDLPVKDQSPSRFMWSSPRRFGRHTALTKLPVGEFDDGGPDLAQDTESVEGDAAEPEDTSHTRRDTSPRRRERSRSPRRNSLGSPSSSSGSVVAMPTARGRMSLPTIGASSVFGREKAMPEPTAGKASPTSSGNTSPLHGSPRLRRHLRKSDDGPVPVSQDLQVAFSAPETVRAAEEGSVGKGLPPPPPTDPPPTAAGPATSTAAASGQGSYSMPKSRSMPEVGTDHKALEELCQSVTAKLDALANKPLPGRSAKTPPQPVERPEPMRKRSPEGAASAAAGAAAGPRGPPSGRTPDEESDNADIKRPDKSRTMPPTSLTTSLPTASSSSAKVVLTSPAPADRSRLSLPVAKVNLQPEEEPDEVDCEKVAEDLQRALDLAIQTFKKVPKDQKQSSILKQSLTSAQSTLSTALGLNESPGPENFEAIVSDTAKQTAQQTAQHISDKLLDLLKSKLDQALQ